MNLNKAIFCGLLASTLIPTSLTAGDFDDDSDGFLSDRGRLEPRYQIGLQVSYRIDDLDQYDYTPAAGAQFLYHFHNVVALVGGFSFNGETRLNQSTSFRTFGLQAGFRFRSPEKLFTPILEIGLAAPTFWGETNGRTYTETKAGVRFAAGISFSMGESYALDLSVSQILNHVNTYDVMVMGANNAAPCPIGQDCGSFTPRNPIGAYNAARFEMLFRLGL
jgi:hypothetical protein